MTRCRSCGVKYPDHLVTAVHLNGGTLLACPICALRMINELHGDNRTSFTNGSQAEAYRQEALKFRARGVKA